MKCDYVGLLGLAFLLSACSADMEDVGVAPDLSPVGSGLISPAADTSIVESYPIPEQGSAGWIGGSADLFRDQRAHNAGDIVTVLISIDDKASLNNNSNRSRKSQTEADLSFNYNVLGAVGADLNGQGDVNSNSSSSGQGSTARSEKIKLSIAAVVTEVLPNGHLLINGTQEILVNYESRILRIGGVVHPRDISSDNTVSYDKVAEARISYGGRGRITEVQQPGWGQQLWDRVTPF
jgi:flagellar L-ring protein precursor FlgH